ncbi:MAG: hypothetical protein E7280_03325 [Lachnospiraceae bacterium]|nr:hypothetical protein [Lachnospiraceae bacterium]
MKTIKKLLGGTLAVVMILSILPANIAKADGVSSTIPSKVRSYTGSESSFSFKINGKEKVKSVKSNSTSLIVKLTSSNYSVSGDTVSNNDYTISMLGRKSGTYTVTVKFSNNATKKVTVYNYPSPIKSWKVGGKKNGYLSYTTKKTTTFRVTLAKGYTLKKLQYNKYVKQKNDNGYTSEQKYVTFKNGGKVKINTAPYQYKSTYSSESYSSDYMSDSLIAHTYAVITYKDKYTKKNETINVGIASVICP